jgi:hypothetical protein
MTASMYSELTAAYIKCRSIPCTQDRWRSITLNLVAEAKFAIPHKHWCQFASRNNGEISRFRQK